MYVANEQDTIVRKIDLIDSVETVKNLNIAEAIQIANGIRRSGQRSNELPRYPTRRKRYRSKYSTYINFLFYIAHSITLVVIFGFTAMTCSYGFSGLNVYTLRNQTEVVSRPSRDTHDLRYLSCAYMVNLCLARISMSRSMD